MINAPIIVDSAPITGPSHSHRTSTEGAGFCTGLGVAAVSFSDAFFVSFLARSSGFLPIKLVSSVAVGFPLGFDEDPPVLAFGLGRG